MVKKTFVITSAFLVVLAVITNSAYALVSIEPVIDNASIFSAEHVFNVTISGVNNVYGFQFDLIYDSEVFEITHSDNITEGNFLSNNGQDQTHCINPDLSTFGLIDNYGCSRIGSGSMSGSGTLAQIKLAVKPSAPMPYISNLVFSNVKISDINSQSLDNSSQDGVVNVYECLYGETRSCVGGTRTCTINNLWGSCETTPPPPGDGPPGGGPPPPSGPPPSDNGDDQNGVVSIIGDVVEDDCVNILDLTLVATNFGLSSGFEPNADVNDDGVVNIFDLVLVALDFGKGDSC